MSTRPKSDRGGLPALDSAVTAAAELAAPAVTAVAGVRVTAAAVRVRVTAAADTASLLLLLRERISPGSTAAATSLTKRAAAAAIPLPVASLRGVSRARAAGAVYAPASAACSGVPNSSLRERRAPAPC
jgi:hypothetical protein